MKGINGKIFSRKKIAIYMAVVFVISAAPLHTKALTTQEKIDQLRKEQEQTKGEKDNIAEERNDLVEQTDSLKGTLNKLNADLTKVSDNLAVLETAIIDKKEDIVQAEADLEEAIAIREEQYETMKLRIQFMYESRDYVLLETLLASSDFSDFLNRNEYVEQLAAYDDMKLEEFKAAEQAVADEKANLIAEREQLDEMFVMVQEEQDRVSELVSQTAGTISVYRNQISQAEQDLLALEQQEKEQNETMEQLQIQLRKEQELARRAALSVWRNISDVTFAEGDRYLLANLIYCEAGNQPYSGQVAVGAVVINRVLSPVFPDTITGVIYQSRQFSPVGSGRLALALTENRATQACYNAADEAMAGATTVGNCLFFRTPIEGLTGISIGGHIFYGNH